MNIITKFDCGQEVFVLFQNKIRTMEIEDIDISVIQGINNAPKYTVYKNPAGSQWTKIFLENELYGTKQDLLDSL